MDHPWGISGPEFLLYYGIALAAAITLAVYLRRAVRHPRLAEPVPVGDADIVAYLVGGSHQVVVTSLARLVEQGVVRVTRAGLVTRTTATAADPLDQAVLDQLGGRTRPVHELITRASGVAPVAALAKRVVAQGLAYTHDQHARARRLGLVAPCLLLAVGLARFITGVAGEYPVGYLALELVVTIVALVALKASGRSEQKRHTVHGQQVVAAATKSGDVATLVALHGLNAYPDQKIASALASTKNPPHTSTSRHRSARAAAAGSAAGSCGGGSSGGGSSCGGCGGGGA